MNDSKDNYSGDTIEVSPEQDNGDTIPAPSFDPRLGTMLDGRYLILSCIGEGGMGCVYHAKHTLMDKSVAIKLIHSELAHIEDVVKRFEREARSSSRLSDPHCITVTDFGRADDGTLYLVMELLDGKPLDDFLKNEDPLLLEDAIRITKQILKGLSHAHEQGVVHRDLKPENVQLVSHGEQENFVKILDFGIAKIASGAGAGEKLTQGGVVFGTPKYLSPEAALGDDVDHRADLYAVGIIFFEMLTGRPPFAAETAMDTMSMHLTAKPPLLSKIGSFPDGLQEIINRALAKKPMDRYASATDFIEAIEEVVPRGSVLPDRRKSRPSGQTRTTMPIKEKGAGSFILTTLMVLLLIGAVASVLYLFVFRIQEVKGRKVDNVPAVEKIGDFGSSTGKVKKLLLKADDLLTADKPAEAMEIIDEVFAIRTGVPAAKVLLGHAKFMSQDRKKAMKLYEEALFVDGKFATDERLQKHLREALEWKPSRESAAILLASHGGSDGVKLLASLCNSAFTEGELRRIARAALVKYGNEDAINWLDSLTADFKETDKCIKRRETIAQMEKIGDQGFVALLEPLTEKTTKKRLRKTKKGKKGKKKRKKQYDVLIVYKNACLGQIAEKTVKAIMEKNGTIQETIKDTP